MNRQAMPPRPRRYRCHRHGKEFQSAKDLRRHLRTRLHPESTTIFDCPQCSDGIVGNPDNLGRHLRHNHGWVPALARQYIAPLRSSLLVAAPVPVQPSFPPAQPTAIDPATHPSPSVDWPSSPWFHLTPVSTAQNHHHHPAFILPSHSRSELSPSVTEDDDLSESVLSASSADINRSLGSQGHLPYWPYGPALSSSSHAGSPGLSSQGLDSSFHSHSASPSVGANSFIWNEYLQAPSPGLSGSSPATQSEDFMSSSFGSLFADERRAFASPSPGADVDDDVALLRDPFFPTSAYDPILDLDELD